MKIVVLDDYQNALRGLKAFEKAKGHDVTIFHEAARDEAELIERLKGADAVVLTMQRTALSKAVIAASDLKLISQTGRNTSHLDILAATAKGIAVSVGGAGSPRAVSELTWGLILASRRHIADEVQALRGGQWQTTVGMSLEGRTLGIYVFGRIGRAVADVGRAFGMRVVCWGREGSAGEAAKAGFEIAASREEFFASADILSLHLPLNDQTRGSITAEDLARMKPDALIVNTSRAQLIAPGALANALGKGRPGYAAIDVFDEEPAGASEPLLKMKNVIATPHLGYVVFDTYENIFSTAFDHINAFRDGTPVNVINPDVLKG
jgi:D-3-phosphoglycerate dehydrogenase